MYQANKSDLLNKASINYVVTGHWIINL